MNKKKSSFSGQLGFVLAAAGSAVGVGNLWRFPYLAAKDGGGLFLVIYLALVLTFGFTLLASDIAIGRRTKESAIGAYTQMSPKWKFLGVLTFLVPVLIMTYYAVIGGWVTKYAVVYLTGQTAAAAQDNYFTSFITSPVSPVLFALLFMGVTAFIVYNGVEGGIERVSRCMMPILLVLVVVIAGYSLTLHHVDESGQMRTGMDGLLYYITPHFEGLIFSRFLQILLDAMSQLFFSLSVSMGIMITYGSYVKKDVNLSKSLSQIEIFDTTVAFLAGLMIIPAVYVFFGTEGMASGPSLMFVSLPKVFETMGPLGGILGMIFFLMVVFAALTSSVSILETLVANCMEIFHSTRKKTSLVIALLSAAASVIICMGYNVFYFEMKLPNGASAQLLDLMDYISNSFLMPFISLLTCIFVGWIIRPTWICEEMEASGHTFKRKKMYAFMIRYVTPIIMAMLFLQSAGVFEIIKNMFG